MERTDESDDSHVVRLFHENGKYIRWNKKDPLIWAFTRAHHYGLIAPHRRWARDLGDGEECAKRENLQRNTSLYSKLRIMGYGIVAIKGAAFNLNYGPPPAREIAEVLFLVIDVRDKEVLKGDLIHLGMEFDQPVVIYGRAGGDGILISTSNSKMGPRIFTNRRGEPYGMGWPEEKRKGGAIFDAEGRVMNRAPGRPFIFYEDVADLPIKYPPGKPNEARFPAIYSKMHWSEIDVD